MAQLSDHGLSTARGWRRAAGSGLGRPGGVLTKRGRRWAGEANLAASRTAGGDGGGYERRVESCSEKLGGGGLP
ncbi:hypothetical protein NL676_032997 [Syzygium grande]|nr:hypothetical protein NL676_032997 [Syzygium grande]